MAFEQFPYTNFHELNTDWVLKTLKDLKTQAEAAIQGVEDWEARVQAAEAAAQAAETAAETAEESAVSAEAAANNADSRATASETSASQAATQATNAAASASAAQTQATNAATSASAAQTQATNAATAATAAQTAATTAQTAATNAATTASAAQTAASDALTAAANAKAGYYEITLEYPVVDQSSNITLPDSHFQDVLSDIEQKKKPIIIKLIQAGNGQGVIDSIAYLPVRIYDWDQNKIELELEYNLIVYHITWFYPGEGTSHYTRWVITDKVPPAVSSGNSGKFLKSFGSGMTWSNISQVPDAPQEDVGKFLQVSEQGYPVWSNVSQYNPLIVTFTGTTADGNQSCNNTLQNILNAAQAGNLIVRYRLPSAANQVIYYAVPNFYWRILNGSTYYFNANVTWYAPDESAIQFALDILMTGDTQNDLDIMLYEL